MPDPVITGTPAPALQDWVAAVRTADPELAGHMELKGWASKPIAEALVEAGRAHREAEKLRGVPTNELIRLPKDLADAGWADLYTRLGVPKDPKDYSFDGIKRADGTDLDPQVAEFLRAEALKVKIPKDGLREFATGYVKFLDARAAASKIEADGALAVERQKLEANWGTNGVKNLAAAQAGAAAMGIAPEAVAAMEKTVGYAAVMEGFRAIGAKLGEGRFVAPNGGGGGDNLLTMDGAKVHLANLKSDEGFVKKWLAGDVAAKAEMQRTIMLATGLKDTITGQ